MAAGRELVVGTTDAAICGDAVVEGEATGKIGVATDGVERVDEAKLRASGLLRAKPSSTIRRDSSSMPTSRIAVSRDAC